MRSTHAHEHPLRTGQSVCRKNAQNDESLRPGEPMCSADADEQSLCAGQSVCRKKSEVRPVSPCAAQKRVMKRTGHRPSVKALGRLYEAFKIQLATAYKGGAHPAADGRWLSWRNFASAPYHASTHGGRFVVNVANTIAASVYGQYERLKRMPTGGIVVKPSFTIGRDGVPKPGPLFIMEKMPKGWNPATMDWRYAMILPDGKTYGVTRGINSKAVTFCHACHRAARADALFFLPESYRR